MVQLKGDFEGHKDIVVPPLLRNNQDIKEYGEWRNATVAQANTLTHRISQDVNMSLLQGILLQLVESDNFYENFIKEVNQATIKYTPYRNKVDQIAQHKWPLDEEYKEWIKRYVPKDD